MGFSQRTLSSLTNDNVGSPGVSPETDFVARLVHVRRMGRGFCFPGMSPAYFESF